MLAMYCYFLLNYARWCFVLFPFWVVCLEFSPLLYMFFFFLGDFGVCCLDSRLRAKGLFDWCVLTAT